MTESRWGVEEACDYKVINGVARLDFKDYTLQLIVIPYRHYGQIEGMDSVLLYEKGLLETFVTDRPYRCTESKDSGFWSRGPMTQQSLADYLAVAIKVETSLFEGKSRGEIEEDRFSRDYWELCRIIMETHVLKNRLHAGNFPVFQGGPDRFIERVGSLENEYFRKFLVRP